MPTTDTDTGHPTRTPPLDPKDVEFFWEVLGNKKYAMKAAQELADLREARERGVEFSDCD